MKRQAYLEISDIVGIIGTRMIGISAEFTPSYTGLQQAPVDIPYNVVHGINPPEAD